VTGHLAFHLRLYLRIYTRINLLDMQIICILIYNVIWGKQVTQTILIVKYKTMHAIHAILTVAFYPKNTYF